MEPPLFPVLLVVVESLESSVSPGPDCLLLLLPPDVNDAELDDAPPDDAWSWDAPMADWPTWELPLLIMEPEVTWETAALETAVDAGAVAAATLDFLAGPDGRWMYLIIV